MVLLLLACAAPEGASFVAPFDGATGLAGDTVLRVHASSIRLPEGEPVSPELVQVVDLEDGGFVAGAHVVEGGELVFRPQAPFPADATFGWAVIDAPDDARRPVVELHPDLVGEASFSTRSAPRPLDAGWDDDHLCLLFSEPPADAPLRLEVNGEPRAEGTWTPLELTLDGGAERATAACLDGDLGAAPGDVIRVTLDDGTSSTVVVGEGPIEDAWLARHRWIAP